MKLYFHIFYILFLLSYSCLNAQSIYPVQIDQVNNGYVYFNPSSISNFNKFDFSVLNKRYFGLFENIGVNYGSLSYKLRNDSLSKKKHVFGVNFLHEYDGEYLNRTRAQLRYAIQTNLSNQTKLNLGLSFGYFNYYIKSTATNAGSTVWLPDGNIGFWVSGKKYNIGLAINQFTNSTTELFIKSYTLNNFIVLNADYKIEINPFLELMSGSVFRVYKENLQADLFSTLKYKQFMSVGINYKINNGAVYIVGFDNIKIFNENFGFTTSYFVKTGIGVMYNSSQLELNIRYWY